MFDGVYGLIRNLKDFAPVGAMILFGWAVYQYHRSNELSFRKPYWERLLALYLEATSCTAVLARSEDQQEWEASRNNFWRLYYGPLCLVEDKNVEGAMVQFGIELEAATFELRNEKRKALETAALGLAYACRNSIRADWRVPLELLTARKQDQI